MKYLIITKDKQPFYTQWFNFENLYNPNVMDCIFNLETGKHTFDGQTWIDTIIDHL